MKKSLFLFGLIAAVLISCRETPSPAPKTPPVDNPTPKPEPKASALGSKNADQNTLTAKNLG